MKRIIFAIVVVALVWSVGASAQSGYQLFQQALSKEQAEGKLTDAIVIYQRIVKDFAGDHVLAAKALLRLGAAYQKLGDKQAQNAFERIVRDFGDQKEAATEARTRLAALQSAAAPRTKQAAREIWTGLGNELRGARPSPDGRYLIFTDIETGDLAVRDLSTGTNRRLTNTGGWTSGEYTDAGVLSPDGRQVAYDCYVDKENTLELRVASIAAGDPVRHQVVLRTGQNEGAYRIAWMPDGKRLLVVRALLDRTSQIGIVTIQDGSFRSIKSLEWRKPNLLSLSPDGRYVAYDVPAGEAGSPLDVLVLATDGSRETAVVQNPANDSFPLWSPDGSHLLFLSDRTGRNSLWMVPIENGRASGPAVSIKTDVGPIRLLGMTRSGTLYYLEPAATNRNLYVTDLDAVHAAKAPVPATERVISNNIGPTWSRDGEHLAYYSFRDTSADASIGVLVIRSAKTGEERTVPLPTRAVSRFNAGPKWFPDNRSVLVESSDPQGSGSGFYRLTVDTGNTELLTHLSQIVTSYDLSPDGRTIFYAIGAADGQKLVRLDIDSHRETELRNAAVGVWQSGWQIVALAVSPDGMQLAATLIGGVVEVRPAAGGQSRELFRPAVPEAGTGKLLQALAWTPDQRFLLWVRGEGGALWKVPALGGKAEAVGISMLNIKNPAVRPDGKQIVFTGADGPNTSKVWALENFVPAVKASR